MAESNARAARNRTLYLGMLVTLGTVSGTPAFAIAPAGLDAAQIVARNQTARGGESAWRKIDGMAFIGKMDAARPRPALGGTIDAPLPDAAIRHKRGSGESAANRGAKAEAVQLPYRLELKRPHKTRLEIDVQGQAAVQVYDGKEGWKLRPFLGQSTPEPFSPEELKLAANEPGLDGLLINSAANGTRVFVEGQEAVEGHPSYRLKLQLKNGDVRHVWIDAGTFLEIRVDGIRKFDGRPRTTYTYFRDYRIVDGVRVPYLLETTIDGQHTVDKLVIEKIVINPELPDSQFSRPPPATLSSTARPKP